MNDNFTNAGDVLKDLFDKIVPEEASGYTGLFSGWNEIVGPEISMHVAPADVKNNFLILEADHPGWIQKIRMQQESILKEIWSRYPELGIKRLKISIGKGKKNNTESNPPIQRERIVEKFNEELKITPSVASSTHESDEDRKFFELLEIMRNHGDS